MPLGSLVKPKLRKIYQESLSTKADASLHTIPIRVGLMTTIGAQRLSPVFARFQQEYPHIELELLVISAPRNYWGCLTNRRRFIKKDMWSHLTRHTDLTS